MLDLFNFTPIVIIILSIFQTIIGVGILVLGTPILLLIGLEMIEVMKILLPLSILNSSLNILYFKLKHKLIEIDNLMKNYFFLICLPGIFFGLFFIKISIDLINFNFLVAFVIWIILFLSFFYKKKNLFILNKYKKVLISFTGFVHGVTNSGGSFLSILIIKTYRKSVNYIRYQITFFYFFLALFQYFSIFILFENDLLENINFFYFTYLAVGVFIGNLISKRVDYNKLKNLIFALAFLASILLIYQA